jgi:hypothetical protein
MAEPAAVKVELDVEGLPASPLPGDAPGRAGVPAEVDAEVKAETDRKAAGVAPIATTLPRLPSSGSSARRKSAPSRHRDEADEQLAEKLVRATSRLSQARGESEIKPPPAGERLAKRAPVPPEGGAVAPVTKRRRGGGAAPLSGAFCRRSRPRVPLPSVAGGDDDDDLLVATAAVGTQPAVGFASHVGPTGPRPRDAAWEAQLARLAAYKVAHGDCNVPLRWWEAHNPRCGLGRWVNNQRVLKRKLDRGACQPGEGMMTAERVARLTALGFVWDLGAGSRSEPPQLAKDIPVAGTGNFRCPHCSQISLSVLGATALKWRLDGCSAYRRAGFPAGVGIYRQRGFTQCKKVSIEMVEEREATQVAEAKAAGDAKAAKDAQAAVAAFMPLSLYAG